MGLGFLEVKDGRVRGGERLSEGCVREVGGGVWQPVLVPPPLLCSQPSPLSPLSLFLAHYPLRQQTFPWAAVKRTVLSCSHRQPQPEHCPGLLILINTHIHTLSSSHTHSPL